MGLEIHRADSLSGLTGIAHGFFGNRGGVSEGIYASLNCGPGSKDHPAKVAENRARVVAALAPQARLVTLAQIHSPHVHVIGPGGACQAQGDGMVTATPGLMLGIQTADCAPVLFADARAGVIGAAHAGWKGALDGVLEATIAAMEDLGASRPNIAAAIGPCISQANYEVGAEFRARFVEAAGENDAFFLASGSAFRFDLEGYAAQRLARAGIGALTKMGLCTYPPEHGFFSFRRTTHRGEADYGREISAIVLTEQQPAKV